MNDALNIICLAFIELSANDRRSFILWITVKYVYIHMWNTNAVVIGVVI